MTPTPGSSESTLGPSVFVKLGVNGVSTDVLVDTGSPATIVSLKFILKVLADSKDSKQTVEEWRKATMRRFSAPAVTLTSCGSDRLNIIAQIPVVLSQVERQTDAVVLVQKGAPNSLLLRIDLQVRLGFLLMLELHGRVNLLRAAEDEPEPKDQVIESSQLEQSVPSSADMVRTQDPGMERQMKGNDQNAEVGSPPGGVVWLLQNVKVPHGYMKIVRAKWRAS